LDINSLHSQAQSGNEAAQEQLFSVLAGRFRLVTRQRIRNRDDAAEVVQKALMTVAEKYKEVEIETSFAAWANQVLNNKILDHYRAQGRNTERLVPLEDSGSEIASPPSDPDMIRRLVECLKIVRAANKRFGRALVLHYQGFTVVEMCESLGVERSRLYKVLSAARKQLRMCLDSEGSGQ
jgi:RNA polymerase sigma factor (sigma-70 family)